MEKPEEEEEEKTEMTEGVTECDENWHKTLRYKPAGRGFDSRWCHWNFSVT